jgi:hypothetical protein
MGRPWALKSFASQIRLDVRTVRNWINRKNPPNSMEAVERELFGNRAEYDRWRIELRAAFIWEKSKDQTKTSTALPSQTDAENRNSGSPHSKLVDEMQTFLESIGVDPSVFSPSVLHPDEIAHAIDEYLRKWIHFLPRSRSRDVLVRISPYPSIFTSDFQKNHDRYYNFLQQTARYYPEMGVLNAKVDQWVGAKPADQTQAQNKKVILGSSFFFRTDSRKDSWGVIPVGKQQAFGIILPQVLYEDVFGSRHPSTLRRGDCSGDVDTLSASLGRLPNRLNRKVHLFGTDWNRNSTIWFVEELVRHLIARQGSIFVRLGFVQGELLTEFLSRTHLSSMISQIQDLIEFSTGVDESEFPIFLNRNEKAPVRASVNSFDQTLSCALFDLGNIDRLVAGIANAEKTCVMPKSNEYFLFTLRHNLDVPLGIGFSLPMLPFLLKEAYFGSKDKQRFLYAAMRDAAVELYVQSGGNARVEQFREIGIELTEVEVD